MTIPKTNHWTVKESKYVIGANRGDVAGLPLASKEVSNDASVHQIENATKGDKNPHSAISKRECFATLWTHYKRWWCCYTLGGIIFLVIILPILFLVIFPAIAQKLVDDADLPILSAKIMKPTPNSVEVSLVASLKVPPPFTVRLDPINLSLFVDDGTATVDPYVEIGLPEYHLHGNTIITIENQTAELLNINVFQTFLHDAVYNEQFMLSAWGETDAFLGKLKAHLHLDKSVELAGLNKLKGFGINSARAVLPAEPDGTNLLANLSIPNASIVTFELGNVTLNLIVGGVILGNATMENVLLVPGNNTVTARGIVDIRKALQNLPQIISSQAGALANGNVEISASGNSTIYNGEHIDYYEKVLNALTLTAQMPLLSILVDSLKGLIGDSPPSSSDSELNLTSLLNTTGLTGLLSDLGSLK